VGVLANLFDALPSSLGAAAIAPSLLILWTVATMDNRREPARVVLIVFLLGGGSAYLISYLNMPVPGIARLGDWPVLQAYLQATLGVAAPEEALKLIVLVFFCSRYIAYDHPMEGVVYGAAVGLGFAAYENLFYLASNPDVWKTLALVRGLFTVPVHGALGVIIGIYAVKARFGTVTAETRRRGYRTTSYLTGWAIATVLHGLFDFPLLLQRQLAATESNALAWWLILGAVVCGLITLIATRIIYRARRSQAPVHNSFTHSERFQSHPWRITWIVGLVLFLTALPLLGWLREAMA
jgi:RsiW-degrading membrane proteinase PrsW (M82 family)